MRSLRKELLIFGALLVFGALVLPFCIYIVGQNIIGEYAPDAGAFALVRAIWADLGRFSIPAWLLVLSPWGVIVLLRLAAGIWRGGAGAADGPDV